jgi:DNA polymerase-3 subunit gamma/tau
LTRAAEVIATGLTEMRGTTAPRLHLELMCARVLLPGTDVDDRGLHARLDRLERRIGVTEGAPARASTSAVLSSSEGSPSVPVPAEPAEEPPPKPASPASPEPADIRSEPFDKLRTAPVEGQAERAAASSAPSPTSPAEITQLTVSDVRRLWPEVLEEVKGKRRFTWILLSQNAQVAEIRNGTLLLAMSNAGARDSFARGGSEDVLREAMVVVMGADFVVETMVDPSAAPATGAPRTPPPGEAPDAATPAPRASRARAANGVGIAAAEDPDTVASRDDSDLEEDPESQTELLARHLGAEIIAEEDHGA